VRALSTIKQKLVSNELTPRTIVAGTFRGIRMHLNLANQMQVYLGLFERETYPWLKRLSKGIATGIDIGAADGEYTLFFLKKTSASKIYAFEPDPIRVSRIEKNLRLDRGLKLERVLVSSKFVAAASSNNAVCLDSFAKTIQTPCFIKIDVDGAEAEILAGATLINTMRDIRWLIETHSKELECRCLDSLQSAGFKTEIISNAWWRAILPEQRPIPHNRWLAAWKI
jgi:hypothetical protein